MTDPRQEHDDMMVREYDHRQKNNSDESGTFRIRAGGCPTDAEVLASHAVALSSAIASGSTISAACAREFHRASMTFFFCSAQRPCFVLDGTPFLDSSMLSFSATTISAALRSTNISAVSLVSAVYLGSMRRHLFSSVGCSVSSTYMHASWREGMRSREIHVEGVLFRS